MTERTILERLGDEDVVLINRNPDWTFRLHHPGHFAYEDLTRAELLQLADEIRELAGEDFDHG